MKYKYQVFNACHILQEMEMYVLDVGHSQIAAS